MTHWNLYPVPGSQRIQLVHGQKTGLWPLIKKCRQLKTIPNEIEFDYREARVFKTNICKPYCLITNFLTI